MSDRKNKRIAKLLLVLSEKKSIRVRDAAELLGVSEMTIRRDLHDNLDSIKFYGGHIVHANNQQQLAPYDLGQATKLFENEKREACKYCLEYIKPKDTIFVDCGTTLVHLVNMLPADLEITIVCNALNIADQVARKPNIKLILFGGIYQPATASFFSPQIEISFSELAFNVGFFTAAGLDGKLGATCTSFGEAAQKRAAMSRSQKRILVTDSSKIGVVLPACFAQIEDFDIFFTEKGSTLLEV